MPVGETGLTKREFFSLLALGLAVAGGAAAVAMLTGNPQSAVGVSPAPPDRPRQLVAFNLIERSGRPITQAGLPGIFLVVDFGFTSCSLKCQVVNDRMAVQLPGAGQTNRRRSSSSRPR